MSTLAGTDAFVVNRAGVNYQVTAANFMSTVADTDLFIVNRGSVNYKVTGLDVKAYLGGGGGGAGLISFGIVGSQAAINAGGNVGSVVKTGGTYFMGGIIPTGSGFSLGNRQGYYTSSDGTNFSSVPLSGNPVIGSPIVASDGSLVGIGGSAATANGIYRSTNLGGTWNLVQSGSFGNWGTGQAISIDPTSGKIAAVARNPKILYESSDNGVTWTPTTLTLGGSDIYLFAGNNTIVGYNNRWHFSVFTTFNQYQTLYIPQGSSGTVTPNNTPINFNSPSRTFYSMDVSRGLGTDFLLFGCGGSGGASFQTYDATTYASISSFTSPSITQFFGNWVTGANRMMGGPNGPNGSGLGFVTAYAVTSTNGSLTDISSIQPAQASGFSYSYAVGTEIYCATPDTCFVNLFVPS